MMTTVMPRARTPRMTSIMTATPSPDSPASGSSSNTARAQRARAQPGDRGPTQAHHAGLGHQEAVEHVEERRLAGAVGADHAEDLALAHLEAHVGERLKTQEGLRDAAYLEQHLAGRRR